MEEFGIGLPPRLIGKKIGETLYSLNLLPFGAFVKIEGEEGGIESIHSFDKKPIWQRALIVLAGVVSFWLISIVLLSIVFGIGTWGPVSDEQEAVNAKVKVVGIAAGSPAEKAGIKLGDIIKQFSISNFQFSIDKVREAQELTEKYKGKEVILTTERGKEIFNINLIPRVSPPAGEGPMGVVLARVEIKRYPWYLSPIKGIEASFNMTILILGSLVQLLVNLIQGQALPPEVKFVGPIGIGAFMIQVAQLGWVYYLQFIAAISIYLAIFNLLPIPALDGGKLLFLGIEAVRKKPVNPRVEKKITAFFFTILLCLMVWVTIKDIIGLF